MIVKPRHRHVDSAGMTYLPYLSNWSSKSSNLRDLISTMCKVFGEDPPVRDKPKNAPKTSSSSSTSSSTAQKTSSTGRVRPLLIICFGRFFHLCTQTFEDPGAVIKRNAIQAVTEKLRRELKATYEKLAADIDELMAAGSVDPRTRKQKELVSSNVVDCFLIVSVQRKVRGEVEATKSKYEELTRWLAANDKGGEVDIDAITEPRDALSNQLLHLVAADAAMEDCMYYLEKALMTGSLSTAEFLKVGVVVDLTVCSFVSTDVSIIVA